MNNWIYNFDFSYTTSEHEMLAGKVQWYGSPGGSYKFVILDTFCLANLFF